MKKTKKQQIDSTAKALFWKHGFKKVTIEEVCKKAHVSRKTFYTMYENKSALVISLLSAMTNKALEDTRLIMAAESTFSKKMEKILTLKFESSKEFSKEFVADFYNPDSAEILQYFTEIMGESMLMTFDFFKNAQERGEMNPDLNLNYVMWLMQKFGELSGTDELMSMFPDVESMTKQVAQSIIYGVMPIKTIHY